MCWRRCVRLGIRRLLAAAVLFGIFVTSCFFSYLSLSNEWNVNISSISLKKEASSTYQATGEEAMLMRTRNVLVGQTSTDDVRREQKNPSPNSLQHEHNISSPNILRHGQDTSSPSRLRHGQVTSSPDEVRHNQQKTSPNSLQHEHDATSLKRMRTEQDSTSSNSSKHEQNKTSQNKLRHELNNPLNDVRHESNTSSVHHSNHSTSIMNRERQQQTNSTLFHHWNQAQESRKRHIQERCTALRNDSSAPHLKYDLTEEVLASLNHLLVVDSHKLIYCYVPKVGCTSWKRIFLVLLGKFKNISAITHIRAHYTPIPNLSKFTLDEAKHRLNNYTTFMISRDPFKRVLSCFRDKFEKDTSDNRGLLRNVLKQVQRYSGGSMSNNSVTPSPDALPRVDFSQFVQYVSDPANVFNHIGPTEHWNEVYKMCHPCLVHYDYIGEFDTLTQDARFILEAAGLNQTISFPEPTNPTNSSGDTVTKEYMSRLNKKELTALNKRYEIDAELFGYSQQITSAEVNESRKHEGHPPR